MIDFDDVEKMIEHLGVCNVRVKDLNGNLLYTIEEENPAISIIKFKDLKTKFSSYGRLLVQLCSESNVKQGWKNGYEYTVFFSSQPASAQQQQQPTANASGLGGFSVADIVSLKVDNAILKMQLEQGNNKNTLPEIPASYLGVLQAFGLVSGGNSSALAGNAATGAKLTLNTTEKEQEEINNKLTQVENLLSSILTKVDIEKVILVLTQVDKNPALIDTVLQFYKQ
jgi:hypothetical protein